MDFGLYIDYFQKVTWNLSVSWLALQTQKFKQNWFFYHDYVISMIFVHIYLTSSKHTPQINMSTFLDEAETSLDACKKQEAGRSVHLIRYCHSVKNLVLHKFLLHVITLHFWRTLEKCIEDPDVKLGAYCSPERLWKIFH